LPCNSEGDFCENIDRANLSRDWRIDVLVLLYALTAAGYVLLLAVASVLLLTYRRTHNVGYIWLLAAVLVWPFTLRLLAIVVEHGGVGPFPVIGLAVPLLRTAQQVFGLSLLLIAVRCLSQQKEMGSSPTA
jgi:hypothetical protein